MSITLTLWPACVRTHPFERQLEAAARAGFDALAISPLTWKALRARGMSAADIRALAAHFGVTLGHYDGFSAWSPLPFSPALPEAARTLFSISADECLRMCVELGLPSILATGAFLRGEVPVDEQVKGFGRFCDRAAAHGIGVDLEFIPMWGVPDLAAAWEIVHRVDRPNAHILLDTWHFRRGKPDMELLRALPAGVIRTVQLADAGPPRDDIDLFEDTLRYRMLPGSGVLGLEEIVEVLVDKGGVRDIGPELYSDQMDALTAVDAARQAADALRKLLARSRLQLAVVQQ